MDDTDVIISIGIQGITQGLLTLKSEPQQLHITFAQHLKAYLPPTNQAHLEVSVLIRQLSALQSFELLPVFV